MIYVKDNLFALHTEAVSYVFRVTDSLHLEHLHFGRKITVDGGSIQAMKEKHEFLTGSLNSYDEEHRSLSLENYLLEMSSYGKGDIREPFVEIIYADGSSTSDFMYDGYKVLHEKPEYETLPGSYSDYGRSEQLVIYLRERYSGIIIELHYYVYERCDVICRSAKLRNESNDAVTLRRLMSAQVDFDDSDYIFTHFNGAWIREMKRVDTAVTAGRFVNSSYTGTSSNRANPFVMLSRRGTSQNFGECYGFNLIYSGNHYEAVDVGCFSKLRFVNGINPQGFSYVVGPGEYFEAPESVMSYSDKGFNGLSGNMHEFVREHIMRGTWKYKERPVLLNSWEAAYFDINGEKLLSLAEAGAEVGIELFVMDDGWFGKRNDDTSSLGDWEVNEKKLPGGIRAIADKIKELGLKFGIWVEPEMVSVKSRLYEEHPDWVIEIPGKNHSESRNQRMLDMGNEDVQNYVIETMSGLFSSADISYVKWDMNRTFTDYYSKTLPSERQGEMAHRYVVGLYRCMKTLTGRFPDILFEGCASGGNRFDLGILCYFPQIWASDNTDAMCRARIQEGYSYGYPMLAVGAHVSSCPNHQTLRNTPLETRFNVAAFALCGYECNLCEMSEAELDAIKEQIDIYKEWRSVLQFGDFYRQDETDEGNVSWTCVGRDKRCAAGLLFQGLAEPNMPDKRFIACGLRPDAKYHFYNRKFKVKTDSVQMQADTEDEDYHVYGDALMNSGVRLSQGFAAAGYNERVRVFQDFASRMYFMEEE